MKFFSKDTLSLQEIAVNISSDVKSLPPLRNPEILIGANDLTTLSYLHEPAGKEKRNNISFHGMFKFQRFTSQHLFYFMLLQMACHSKVDLTV